MTGIHNLKPDRVVKVFVRQGWTVVRQSGSHVHLAKEGSSVILSIPVHKGKPIRAGLIKDQIAKAGMTVEEFLDRYK